MKNTFEIAHSFGSAAKTYALHSSVQEKAALQLGLNLQGISDNLPPGPVLEIACGTGVFTRQLATLLPEREFTISDISTEMVDACRANSELDARYTVIDAEQIDEENNYALIVCAFAAQWFSDIETVFDGIFKALIPGGYFLFSLPTDGSFPQWKETCEELGSHYSGNALPQAKAIEVYCQSKDSRAVINVQQISTKYSSSLFFFRALKGLGAAHRLSNHGASLSLESTSLLPVIRHWDKKSTDSIYVTYEVLFGALQK
ncbi:MAG: methyltransferase domain-containing protein [Candidatus Obscuribacterales bacterium]|nr:methyltransferase domain-containing protein [Candidatus Obscuribacterales bacterium]